MLGDSTDRKLQLYLKIIQANKGAVSNCSSQRLVIADNRNKLFEYGGHIKLNRSWAYALFNRMGLVPRKPTTSKSRMDGTDFTTQKRTFLNDLVTTVQLECRAHFKLGPDRD